MRKIRVIVLLIVLGVCLLGLQNWQNANALPLYLQNANVSTIAMKGIKRMFSDMSEKNRSMIDTLLEWAPLDGQESLSTQLLSALRRGQNKTASAEHANPPKVEASVEAKVAAKPEAPWLFIDEDDEYYLKLPLGNFAEYYPVTTTWEKIRIKSIPQNGDTSIELDLHDWKYSKTSSHEGTNHHNIKQMEWGITADCRLQGGSSSMKVNLTGTPFAYKLITYGAAGSQQHGSVTCSKNNQVCDATCGGHCGYCGFGHPGLTEDGLLSVVDQAAFDAVSWPVWQDESTASSGPVQNRTSANRTTKHSRRKSTSKFASSGDISKRIFKDGAVKSILAKFQFVERTKNELNYYLGTRHDFIMKPDQCWLWGVTNSIGSVFEIQLVAGSTGHVTLRSVTVDRYVRAVAPGGEGGLEAWVLVPDAKDTKQWTTHFNIEFEGDFMYLRSVKYNAYINIPHPASASTDSGCWRVRTHGVEGTNSPARKNDGAKLKLVTLAEKDNKEVKSLLAVWANIQKNQTTMKPHNVSGISGGTRIAIGSAITSKGTVMNTVGASPFFSVVLQSFLATWEGPGPNNPFQYTWYVGFDKGDRLYDNEKAKKEFHRIFNATVKSPKVTLKLMSFPDTQGAPSWAVSGVMEQAYKDGADWLYQLNDDSRLISRGWERALTDVLAKNPTAKFLGATGPTDSNNDRIFTHVFTHRTHLDIHGRFFPKAFKNYYSDDWISKVYGQTSTFKMPNVRLKHEVHAQKAGAGIERYKADFGGWRWLTKELEYGSVQVAKYLKNLGIAPRLEPVCGFPAYLEKMKAEGLYDG